MIQIKIGFPQDTPELLAKKPMIHLLEKLQLVLVMLDSIGILAGTLTLLNGILMVIIRLSLKEVLSLLIGV